MRAGEERALYFVSVLLALVCVALLLQVFE